MNEDIIGFFFFVNYLVYFIDKIIWNWIMFIEYYEKLWLNMFFVKMCFCYCVNV